MSLMSHVSAVWKSIAPRRQLAATAAIFGTALAVAFADEQRDGTDLYGDPIPGGAAVRLGTTRFRVAGSKNGLAFAADDETLVIIGNDRKLILLEAATGRRLREISTGDQHPQRLCLTPERLTVLTFGHEFNEALASSAQTVQRFDILTGNLISKSVLNDKFGGAVAIDPDGRMAITGSGDGTLAAWSLVTAKEIESHAVGRGGLHAVAISPDGSLIAAAGQKGVFLWERRAGKAPVQIAGSGSGGRYVQSLAFSPDGALLAEGPGYGTEIILRDVRTRTVRHRLSDAKRNSMYVNSLTFTSDGAALVAGNAAGIRGLETRIHVWDVATGQIQRQFQTGAMQPYHVALSGDDQWLAAAGSEAVVKVWDFTTGMSLMNEAGGHDDGIVSLHFSPEGATIVTASDDGAMVVWETATGKQKHVMRHGHWVRGAALSPDGRRFASSSLDDTVRLWETETGKEIYRLPGHGELGGQRAVQFSADGKRFASWGDDYYLRVWDVRTGKALSERQVHPAAIKLAVAETDADSRSLHDHMRMGMDQAVFSGDGKRLALAMGSSISIFNVESGQQVAVIAHADGHLIALAFSPDGTRVATSAWGRPVLTPVAGGGTRSSASKNHMARVHDVDTDKELFQVPLPDEGAGPLAYSNDGRFLATANWSADTRIHVLDASTGKLLATFEGLPARARSLAFTADGKRLACGFNDGSVLIWNLKTAEKTP